MADLDFTRWNHLLDACRNAHDSGPSPQLQIDTQRALQAARAELERHVSLPVHQQGKANQWHSPEQIAAQHARTAAELERRVERARREVERVQALAREAGARRAALFNLVETVRAWAAMQVPPVVLPDDDRSQMPVFEGLPVARVRGASESPAAGGR
jgi:hypothetical protein